MKQVSTGAGLVALGFCTLASTIVFTQRERGEAFAAATPVITGGDDHATFLSTDRKFPNREYQLLSCITSTAPWFDPTPRPFVGCGALNGIPSPPGDSFTGADLNGDGEQEYFRQVGVEIVVDGAVVTPSVSVIARSIVNSTNHSAEEVLVGVAQANSAWGELALQQNPDATWAAAWIDGFRDLDGDGDKDAFVHIWSMTSSGDSHDTFFWIENTGFQHSMPLDGDLDHDGHVNNADLSLLLLNFTD